MMTFSNLLHSFAYISEKLYFQNILKFVNIYGLYKIKCSESVQNFMYCDSRTSFHISSFILYCYLPLLRALCLEL